MHWWRLFLGLNEHKMYNMKFQVFLLSIILSGAHSVIAQEQKTIAKFIIQDARLNKVDVTARFVETNAYVVVYKTKEGNTYMAVVMDKDDTQSFGRIFNMEEVQKTPETDKEYQSEVYNFMWSYKNSYDNKKGTARVRLTKIYKPLGIMFTTVIIPEDLEIMAYKGYMEGTIGYGKD